ncbi:MAG: hypothetical protein KG012_15925 [Deltaproteobacteria bacterium]|nr:hypothetical protein [Deltaproteobacteria bacterium]
MKVIYFLFQLFVLIGKILNLYFKIFIVRCKSIYLLFRCHQLVSKIGKILLRYDRRSMFNNKFTKEVG